MPFYAGARIAEVAALDLDDVKISARKGSLHLVGKGEKSRELPLHPVLREALAAWIAERPAVDSPALFISRRGQSRMSTDAVDDVIHGITGKAGLDDEISAHVLRHTFATRICARELTSSLCPVRSGTHGSTRPWSTHSRLRQTWSVRS